MEISYRFHKTISGEPLSVPIKGHGQFKDSMTTVGNGHHILSLAGTKFSRADWQDATRHWSRTLVECHDGVPKYAGLIQKHGWDHDNKLLHLWTVTVDAVMRSRYPFGVGSYDQDPDFEPTMLSLRAAVEEALYRMIGGDRPTWGPEWGLPFLFHHRGEAGTFSKAWAKHDWALVDDIVKTIRRVLGGPDLAFIPTYQAGNMLAWDVLAGNPRVTGPTVDLPLSVRNSRARGLFTTNDGSNMSSGIFNPGEGRGPTRPVGRAGYFDGRPAGAPEMIVRDLATNANADTDSQTILDEQAEKYLTEHTFPVKQREFQLNIEARDADQFSVADVRLGTRFGARFSGDEFEDPFNELLYVVALAFNSTKRHTYLPEVQKL